jgi:glyoxylase-like metal-dependent hydrolase (beta-lactamase superfamily II)
MFFKQLATKESSLSYLFGCAGHGKAVAVDVVAGDEDWFLEEARKGKSVITHVIDTHVHADHLSRGAQPGPGGGCGILPAPGRGRFGQVSLSAAAR